MTSTRLPRLCRHRGKSLGYVLLNGRMVYLGSWPAGQKDPPPDVKAAYDRAVAEWLARGRAPTVPAVREPAREETTPASTPRADEALLPAGLTVGELCVRFLEHAERHYRRADGSPTNEIADYRSSLRPLCHLYPALAVDEFSPLKLKAVRELMVKGYVHPKHGEQTPLSRKVINQRIGRIVRMFTWGASEELVGPLVIQGLKTVRGLQHGRCDARETAPVEPVDPAVVERTLPYLLPGMQAMVRLQMFTGARPGEVCGLRDQDLDTGGPVWLYRIGQHKTAHRGKARVVVIGPKGQEVLTPLLKHRCPSCGIMDRAGRIGWCATAPLCGPCRDRMDEQGVCGPWLAAPLIARERDYHVFSPAEIIADRDRERRAKRKSRVQPSQRCRKKAKPKRKPRQRYDTAAYDRAIRRACEKASVPPWHPHQLRHSHATEVRKRYGLEAAQVVLGHSQANVTEVYAERDTSLAVRVALDMG